MITKLDQYGFKRSLEDIKGITIHETNNYRMDGKMLFYYLQNDNLNSDGCHYIVDQEEIIQVMPDDYGVYHTGKGYDYGNKYTIAIEMCSNLNDELFNKTINKTIYLINTLLEKYDLSKDDIFFHIDFDNRTYCPKTLLNMYGSSKNFIKKLKEG